MTGFIIGFITGAITMFVLYSFVLGSRGDDD
jgi:hypothetical protein